MRGAIIHQIEIIMKKINAPIDEKNVTTDWIEEVFDNSCTKNGNSSVGFIDGQPVFVSWFENVMFWQFINGYSKMEVLKDRLSKFEDQDQKLFSEINKTGNILIQKFYFKDDD